MSRRLEELQGRHSPETDEYGIYSFVYHAWRPFHPERPWETLDQTLKGVFRAKGFLDFQLGQDVNDGGAFNDSPALVICAKLGDITRIEGLDKVQWLLPSIQLREFPRPDLHAPPTFFFHFQATSVIPTSRQIQFELKF
jgi:hypothetical protein